MSVERTFHDDLINREELNAKLSLLAEELDIRLCKRSLRGKTFTLKITYNNFEKVTRSVTSIEVIEGAPVFIEKALGLLAKTEAGTRPIRLLGLGISSFAGEEEDCSPPPLETQLPLTWESQQLEPAP